MLTSCRWDIDVDYAVDSAKFAALHAMAKNATLLSSFGLAYKAIEPAAWHAPDMARALACLWLLL